MTEFERQEHEPSTRRLRELLRELPSPRARSEEEWRGVEEGVFAALDNQYVRTRHAVVLHRSPMFRSFTRPLIAAAALLILAVNVVVLLQKPWATPPRVLADSSILDTEGRVAITGAGGGGEGAWPGVCRGQRFETGDDGAVTAQLGDGTGFRLSRNSRLEVVVAAGEAIRLHLEYGDVLFSVRKRESQSEFVVTTPNAECRVVGTIFQVTAKAGSERVRARTDLAVYQGTVRIADRDKRSVATAVETGFMVSLCEHRFDDVFGAPANANSLRDISLLNLALELPQDSLAAPAGLVEFMSQPPQARVIVGDQVMGTTPMVLRHPVGAYSVTMSLDGYRVWTGVVDVRRMRTSVLSAALEPLALGPARPRQSVSDVNVQEAVEEQPEGYVNRPEYVEALIQITVGEYGKALVLLDSLKRQRDLSPLDRAYVIQQISLCYRSLGDFRRALRALKREYRRAEDSSAKANLLWEMATINSTCLGDWAAAHEELSDYLTANPEGPWAEEARERLADVKLMLEFCAR